MLKKQEIESQYPKLYGLAGRIVSKYENMNENNLSNLIYKNFMNKLNDHYYNDGISIEIFSGNELIEYCKETMREDLYSGYYSPVLKDIVMDTKRTDDEFYAKDDLEIEPINFEIIEKLYTK